MYVTDAVPLPPVEDGGDGIPDVATTTTATDVPVDEHDEGRSRDDDPAPSNAFVVSAQLLENGRVPRHQPHSIGTINTS